MRSYKFIGTPKFVKSGVYENTIDKIVDLLKHEPSIRAIYRLGNVNHPGISDLDIVVLFKNGSNCMFKPENAFNTDDKYLFTHNLFGASEAQFEKVIKYCFWDNLECIYGESLNLESENASLSGEEEEFYKKQLALEFLYKNFIELSVQLSYKVVKLRSVLQEIKGIRYDLSFLNINNLTINKCIEDFLKRLDHWFESDFDPHDFSLWLDEYYEALKESIKYTNHQGNVLWVPKEGDLKYGRNVTLKNGEQLSCKKSGVFLPSFIIADNKRVFNAHRRLNQFVIRMKLRSEDSNGMNQKRLNAFIKHKEENRLRYPHFDPLLSSLANQFI